MRMDNQANNSRQRGVNKYKHSVGSKVEKYQKQISSRIYSSTFMRRNIPKMWSALHMYSYRMWQRIWNNYAPGLQGMSS